jgi:hypothetical protein
MSDATTDWDDDDNGEQFTWDASLPRVEGRSVYVLEWSVQPGALREAVLFGCPTREDIGKWASSIRITTAALRAGITHGVWVIQRGEVVAFHDFARSMFFVFPDGARISAADAAALAARTGDDGEFPEGTRLEDEDPETVLASLPDLSAPVLRDGETMSIGDPQGVLAERDTYLRRDTIVACGPNDCEGGVLAEWLELSADFDDDAADYDSEHEEDDAESLPVVEEPPAKKSTARKPAKKSAKKAAAKKPSAKKPTARKPVKAVRKSAKKAVAKQPAKAVKKPAKKPAKPVKKTVKKPAKAAKKPAKKGARR